MARAVLAALAALFIVAGAASAASPSPDMIGGTLTAGGHKAIVTSTATMPVRVTVTGTNVTADPATFTLDPGKAASLTLDGPAKGTLTALLTVMQPAAGDTASVNLTVNLEPAPPAPPFPWQPVGVTVLLLSAALLLLRRVKPWQYRLTRAP